MVVDDDGDEAQEEEEEDVDMRVEFDREEGIAARIQVHCFGDAVGDVDDDGYEDDEDAS